GVLLLAGWETIGRLYGSEWTSRPSLVAVRLASWLHGSLYIHVATTLTEVVTGLMVGAAFGVVAGLLLGRAPLIALAPLFIMFFGLDMLPKIVLVTIVVFFLLFFNTFAGAASVDNDLIAQIELMGSPP